MSLRFLVIVYDVIVYDVIVYDELVCVDCSRFAISLQKVPVNIYVGTVSANQKKFA
jgi:hypothetical protein